MLLTVVVLAVACGEEEDFDSRFWENLSCGTLASLATQMSKDDYPDSHIVKIYRLRQTFDSPTLRECEGAVEFADGHYGQVTLWADEKPNGDLNGAMKPSQLAVNRW